MAFFLKCEEKRTMFSKDKTVCFKIQWHSLMNSQHKNVIIWITINLIWICWRREKSFILHFGNGFRKMRTFVILSPNIYLPRGRNKFHNCCNHNFENRWWYGYRWIVTWQYNSAYLLCSCSTLLLIAVMSQSFETRRDSTFIHRHDSKWFFHQL